MPWKRDLPPGQLPEGKGCAVQQAGERPVLRLPALRLPQGLGGQAPPGPDEQTAPVIRRIFERGFSSDMLITGEINIGAASVI